MTVPVAPTKSPPLRRLAGVSWRAAGWVAVVLLFALQGLESTGVLRALVLRQLSRELPGGAGSVQLSSAELRWLRRSLVLEGLSIGEQRIDRIELLLGRPWEPLTGLERVVVRGGRVQLDRLPELLEERSGASSSPLPELRVEGLELALSSKEAGGELTLGSLRMGLARARGDVPALEFRGQLARERDSGGRSQTHLAGRVAEDGASWELTADGEDLPVELLARLLPTLIQDVEGDLDLELRVRQQRGAMIGFHARLDLGLERLVPAAPSPPIEEVRLQLQLASGAGVSKDWTRDWQAELDGAAQVAGMPVRIGGERSRSGDAQLWLALEELPLGTELDEALGGGRDAPWSAGLEEMHGLLEPEGSAHLRGAITAYMPSLLEPPAADSISYALVLDPAGKAGLHYRGQVSPLRGRRDAGFPLHGREVTGRVMVAGGAGSRTALQVGLVDLNTRVQESHHVDGSGSLFLNSFGPAAGSDRPDMDFHLVLQTPELDLDGEVEEALQGLSGILPPERTWDLYQPSGGTASARVELWSSPEVPAVAALVDVGFQDASLAWRTLPVPLSGMNGRLLVASNGQLSHEGGSRVGVALDLQGEAPITTGPITVELFLHQRLMRDEPGEPVQVESAAEWLKVTVEGGEPADPIFLEALDRSPLTDLRRILELDIHGPLDVEVRREREPLEGGVTLVEVHPGSGARLVLPLEELELGNLNGRVIARRPDGPDPESVVPLVLRALPLRATIESGGGAIGLQLEGEGTLEGDRLDLGLHVNDLGLRRHAELLRTLGGALSDGATLELLDEGSADAELDARLQLVTPSAGEREVAAVLWLRDGSFTPDSSEEEPLPPLLSRLRGAVEVDEEGIRSRQLDAELLGRPMMAQGLRASLPGRTGADGLGFELELDVVVDGLQLDRRSLGYVLPPEALRSLIDDLDWRCEVDRLEGRLQVERTGEELDVALAGSLDLGPTGLRVGIPVQIGSARLPEFGLRVEGGQLRFWSRVEQIFGRVAGRALDRAGMLVSYVGPRLSVRDLEGGFADGRLSTLGMEGRGSEEFFSMDLAAPYPFALSARLEDVEAGELLSGLFESNFANRGRVDASLRIDGDLAQLTGIEGRGEVRLEDSSLWAIPVFQALFSQLGFETTATFQAMEARMQLERGRISLSDMRLESDLLNLVGEGWIDLDGRISNNLEVRYSLVDRLGPLNYIVYLVQNGLLRVFVRGDLDRPRVQLGGALSLVLGHRKDGERLLTLPGPSPLPERF